jgi:hypothetical protein
MVCTLCLILIINVIKLNSHHVSFKYLISSNDSLSVTDAHTRFEVISLVKMLVCLVVTPCGLVLNQKLGFLFCEA